MMRDKYGIKENGGCGCVGKRLYLSPQRIFLMDNITSLRAVMLQWERLAG